MALQAIIDQAWDARDGISAATKGEVRDAVQEVLAALDAGKLRVAEKSGGAWVTHQWIKKAVLLSFRLNPMQKMGDLFYDKVALKTKDWSVEEHAAAGVRIVPGAIVRHSAYIAPGAVLMPCFINIGAHVGEGTMIDTWSTVGSCAQIGRHCHISGGVGIGGVLEPLQAAPVIIEDNVFIGARSEVAEGVVVEEGAVLSMGVYLGASTKIIDRSTGEVSQGRVPAYSVVVPGSIPGGGIGGAHLYCAVIVKRVDEKTRAKTAINDLLRGV